ncbi:hypothetical protein SRABI70_02238 [Pseudomonas sp. Bi70]|nr:hypothetical protein F469_04702 [Pseudomonas sp. URMO17WK12:I2]CAH0221193.1 hypothetical protein SRABI70_02238 [Pseudomonas sp. Bi70]
MVIQRRTCGSAPCARKIAGMARSHIDRRLQTHLQTPPTLKNLPHEAIY